MVLFTSAVPGKKAAPKKAPARRRPAPAPTGPPPSAQSQPPESVAATSVTLPSSPPPPTRAAEALDSAPTQHELPPAKEPNQPPSEPVREPEVQQLQPESDPDPDPEPHPEPPAEPEQRLFPVVESETEAEPTTQTVPEPVLENDKNLPSQPILAPSPEPAEHVQQPDVHIVDSRNSVAAQSEPLQAQEPVSTAAAEVSLSETAKTTAQTLQEQRLEEFRQVTTAHVLEAANVGASKTTKRTAAEDATSTTPRPIKKAKRSSARSNAKATAIAHGDNVVDSIQAADSAPATTKSGGKKAKNPTTGPLAATRRSTRTPKSTAKKIRAFTSVGSDDEMEGPESAGPEEEQPEEGVEMENVAKTSSAASKRRPRAKPKTHVVTNRPKKPRKKRMPTTAAQSVGAEGDEEPQAEAQADAGDESDPEAHEIDPNTLSMWDLSYDSRHGQMSERGKMMNEIDWNEVAAKRKMEANLIAAGGPEQAPQGAAASTEARSGAAEGQAEGAGEGDQEAAAASATPAPNADDDIGFQLDEEGNIVEDATTMQFDRTAAAMAAAVEKPVEDINDLTVHINRISWINNNRREATDRVPLWKWKSDPWSEDETDRFYDALRMFGTDFLVISKMFPGKTRRMIKTKFTREEKIDGQRVTDALLGKHTVRMDLNHYARESSRDVSVFTKYEGLEHAQQVINESMRERQEAMTTAVQQEAQLEAEKREKEKEREKDKARRPRKTKKSIAAGTFGGGGPAEEGD